ncbi:FAD-dependent monooxygenase [Kitasatospora paranensis]|uniref:FAD-dependent monooxygenase n=1 Tax=Kitasatospora paranensis TaxID=258053 RepID=UPI0031E6FE7E
MRRGHRLTTLDQDADRVTADLTGPDGPYRITARYLVGADGGHSTVRKQCGIDFPGITDDRFVALSGQVAVHPPAAVPGTGELDVPGLGRLAPASFTRSENGVFAYGMFQPGVYRISVSEWDRPPVEDRAEGVPLDELRAAVGRVLGADLPIGPPPEGAAALRVRSVVGVNSRVAQRYRDGGVPLVGDAAHVQSGIGGPGLNLGLQDALNLGWKLAEAAGPWSGRLDTVVARPADPGASAPADVVLIRPDGYAAWAVGPGATDPDEAAAGLRAALRTWLGPADRTRPEFADRRYSDRWPGTSSSSAFDTGKSDVP